MRRRFWAQIAACGGVAWIEEDESWASLLRCLEVDEIDPDEPHILWKRVEVFRLPHVERVSAR